MSMKEKEERMDEKMRSPPPPPFKKRVLICRHGRLRLVSGWSDGMVFLCPALAHSHPATPPLLKPNLR